MSNFNPNEMSIKGNLFGLDFNTENAKVVVIPVPWEATVSFGSGTSKAPEEVLETSFQIDLFNSDLNDAWKEGISMDVFNKDIIEKNEKISAISKNYISLIENGGEEDLNIINEVDKSGEWLNDKVEEISTNWLNKNKLVALVGGEHSIALGLIKAVSKKYESFSILQIDAHADLRQSYENFKYSHATIMNHASRISNVNKIVQVGIRDYCEFENKYAQNNNKIEMITDKYIKEQLYNGKFWVDIVLDIISKINDKNIYISFDIDGLNPYLCPNTGTPVPGGLEFEQVEFLLKKIKESGKKIIGFDLSETGISENKWDEMVSARILFLLSSYMISTNI